MGRFHFKIIGKEIFNRTFNTCSRPQSILLSEELGQLSLRAIAIELTHTIWKTTIISPTFGARSEVQKAEDDMMKMYR